jgi:hypothetical protein
MVIGGTKVGIKQQELHHPVRIVLQMDKNGCIGVPEKVIRVSVIFAPGRHGLADRTGPVRRYLRAG